MNIVWMNKEGSTKIVNFMNPGPGVLILGRGHINHYSEYVFSSALSIYSTLIAGIMMLPTYLIVDFHFFYDGAVDIQI